MVRLRWEQPEGGINHLHHLIEEVLTEVTGEVRQVEQHWSPSSHVFPRAYASNHSFGSKRARQIIVALFIRVQRSDERVSFEASRKARKRRGSRVQDWLQTSHL